MGSDYCISVGLDEAGQVWLALAPISGAEIGRRIEVARMCCSENVVENSIFSLAPQIASSPARPVGRCNAGRQAGSFVNERRGEKERKRESGDSANERPTPSPAEPKGEANSPGHQISLSAVLAPND